jgi:hypothetical protein
VPVSTVTTLTEYAHAVLAVAETALATTTAGVPDRSYVSPAAPVFDCCPMLTVHIPAMAEAGTAPVVPVEAPARRGQYGNIILVTYVVTTLRCAPSIEGNLLPSVVDMEAAAAEVLEDGWAIWNGIRHAVQDGTLFTDCLGVHFDGGRSVSEQGGCVGWQHTIRAQIPGIPNT